MQLQPYLNFNGRCDEAIEFYKKALGAKINMLMRFKECPEPNAAPAMTPAMGEKVMHASLSIGSAVMLVSDGRCTGTTKFDGFSLSLLTESDAEAQKYFAALSEGGKVSMPLGKTFFATSFGMVTDRFGITWMVLKQH